MGQRLKEFSGTCQKKPITVEGIANGVSCKRSEKENRPEGKPSMFLEIINNCKQNAGRNVNGKGHSDEVSDGKEHKLDKEK